MKTLTLTAIAATVTLLAGAAWAADCACDCCKDAAEPMECCDEMEPAPPTAPSETPAPAQPAPDAPSHSHQH